MSKFVPSDTELIPTPIYYKSLYTGLPDNHKDTPQVYYDNIDLAEENYYELATWGLFLNNHLGRGIQSYLRQPDGKITYPPRFLQGTFLMVLSKEIIKEISTYDLKKSSMVGILDQETDSFHVFDVALPDEIDIEVLKFRGAEFTDKYPIEKDDAELFRASNINFLKSRMAFKDLDCRKSLFHLENVLKENPNYSRAYSARGTNYHEYQDLIYALGNYFDGLEINPKNWRSLYNIGIIMSEVGLFDLARKYYDACLEINSDFKKALYNLSQIDIEKESHHE